MLHLSDHNRRIAEVLKAHGITPVIGLNGGGHLRWRWIAGTREQILVTEVRDGEPRAWRNNLTRVRRMLREAGLVQQAPCADHHNNNNKHNGHPPSLLERVSRLERDVAILMDLLTDHERLNALLPALEAPSALPPPAKKRERRRKGELPWIFKVLRYDEYMHYADVAEAAGKGIGATIVMLTKFKKKGLIQHDRKFGWRKHRDCLTHQGGL